MSQTPRKAVFVDETMLTEHGYVPGVVTEYVPGYTPLTGNGDHSQPWYWGHDLAAAKLLAREYNNDLGLSVDDVTEIRVSSMRASGVLDG